MPEEYVMRLTFDNDNLKPEKVIFQGDLTITIFPDGEKILTRPIEGDEYSRDVGVAMAIARNACGSRAEFIRLVENGHEQKI